MGWIIERVLFGAFNILGFAVFITAALWLIYWGANWADVPSLRIINGVILALVFASLIDRTIVTIRDLWGGYSDRNLILTDLMDGAVARVGISLFILLPHSAVTGLFGSIHPSLPWYGMTIQTEVHWAASFDWIHDGIIMGLVAVLFVNIMILGLTLYIAVGRLLNFDLPPNWSIRTFGLNAIDQTREERDALRVEVNEFAEIRAELEAQLMHAEKEIVALNVERHDQVATARAQKQENIRLSNETERLQQNFRELAQQFAKVEADRNASVQVIEQRAGDLKLAHDRIEHLEQENARQRLRLQTGPVGAMTDDDENPLLTLMALDTVSMAGTMEPNHHQLVNKQHNFDDIQQPVARSHDPESSAGTAQPVDQDAIAELDNAGSAERFIAADPVLTAGPAVDVVPTLETSPDDAAPEPQDSEAAVSRQKNQPIEVAAVLHELGYADPQDQGHDAASGDRGDNVESNGRDPALEADAAQQPPSNAYTEAEAKRLLSKLAEDFKFDINRASKARI